MAVAQASLENLKKGRKFTSETAREAGRKGQQKSLEAKKWKKAKKQLLAMLSRRNEWDIDDEMFAYLKKQGIGNGDLELCIDLMATIGLAARAYVNSKKQA